MKVCIIVSIYFPSTIAGGVTSVAAEHAERLSNRGHSVTVLTSNILSLRPIKYITEERALQGKVEIWRFPCVILLPHFSFFFSPRLIKWLRQNAKKFDVFHVHYGREFFSVTAADILIRLKTKMFLQTHGMLNRQEGLRQLVDIFFVKRQLRGATGLFALQSHEFSTLKSISPNARVLVLPNGINTDGFPSWRMNENKPLKTILFLARLHPRKRVVDFIDAAKILLSKRSDLKFLIVGPDGGDKELALQKIKQDNNLLDHIELIGAVSREEALNIFADSDVYVLPSRDEPFPISLLEALAIGIPCVVTDQIHIVEALRTHDVCEITTSSPAGLAGGVEKLLLLPDLCLRRSTTGKKFINESLNVEDVIAKLEAYYLA